MINFFEINDDYVNYLHKIDGKVLLPKEKDRKQTRKYVGIVMIVNDYKYFIPLSSYKPETYDKMYESVSLMKVDQYAVLRINNMIPANDNVISPIDFKEVEDINYRYLLMSEYRIIKPRENEIRKNCRIVYAHRTNDKNLDKSLYNICCNFKLLEEACKIYMPQQEVAPTKENTKLDPMNLFE